MHLNAYKGDLNEKASTHRGRGVGARRTAPALANNGGGHRGIGSTLFGGATVEKGIATLTSNTGNAATTDDFGGVALRSQVGLTLAQITQLSAEYNVTDDDCGGGSPRFAINYGANKNVFVYVGPSPNFTGCAQNTWSATGNLVGAADSGRVDTSQLTGGSVNSTWAQAVVLTGTQPITSISLVCDGSWKFAGQGADVLVRNVKLNDKTFLVPKKGGERHRRSNASTAVQGAGGGDGLAVGLQRALGQVPRGGTDIGKCVSAMKKSHNAGAAKSQILYAAITSCKAEGL